MPEAATSDGRRQERRGDAEEGAYQGRWREGARDAIAWRLQSPEELCLPLGRSRSVRPRGFLILTLGVGASNWLLS